MRSSLIGPRTDCYFIIDFPDWLSNRGVTNQLAVAVLADGALFYYIFFYTPIQSAISPEQLLEVEAQKLDKISELSSSLVELKKTQSQLRIDETKEIESKCARIKKMRLEEYKKMTKELDAKERDLCRKTNQLVDELVATCDDTPFHKALINILSNLKGKA